MKGSIIDIKRFAVHDGDGIRTTVFFKGCSLKCVWCHNPEGILFKKQLSYIEKKCISCGECVGVCKAGAHAVGEDGIHTFSRESCVSCGACEDVCLGEALKLYGKEYTADELLPILLEDKSFYETSGGGVTVSGGECLMQADFVTELLRKLKEYGINTAVDTCGYVQKSAFDKTAPYTDIYLYDIKAVSPEVHEKCTGHTNELILENLFYIDSVLGKKTEIRVPYIPGYNDNEIEKIAEVIKKLKNFTKLRVLPYHSYAGSKYDALGMENTLPKVEMPNDEAMKKVREFFKSKGICVAE